MVLSDFDNEESGVAREVLERLGQAANYVMATSISLLRGFLVTEHMDQFADGGAEMGQWIAEGKLRVDENVQDGLENASPAFMRWFSGESSGKLILMIA